MSRTKSRAKAAQNGSRNSVEIVNPFAGVVVFTGEPNSGKTAAALTHRVSSPAEFAIFNFDGKEYPPLPWGFYRSYYGMRSDLEGAGELDPETAMVNQVMEDIKALPAGITVAIFDAEEEFGRGLLSWTLQHANNLKNFHGGGTMLAKSKLGYAKVVESSLLIDALLKHSGLQTVYVINHLVDEYAKPSSGASESVPTGRRIPKASVVMRQKASSFFWAVPNLDHPCPIYFVVKDPGIRYFDEASGQVRTKRLLPYRLDPKCLGEERYKGDISFRDMVDHYIQKGGVDNVLQDFENPTAEEFAYIQGVLTDNQKKIWETNAKLLQVFGTTDEADQQAIKDLVAAKKAEGRPLPLVKKALHDELGVDISLPDLRTIYEAA